MKTTISFLTQEETQRLFAAIPTKRDRALFLTASRHGGKPNGVVTPDTPRRSVPGETRPAARLSTALRKVVADRSPHGLRIELEDRAHGDEREAVVGIGQHPLPRFESVSCDCSTGDPATEGPLAFQTPDRIREDGLAETPQPVIYRRVVILYGLEAGSGKLPDIDRHTHPPPFHA